MAGKKKKNKPSPKPTLLAAPPRNVEPPPESKPEKDEEGRWVRFRRVVSGVVVLLTVICCIIGGLSDWLQIDSDLMSDHDRFEKQEMARGRLIAPYVGSLGNALADILRKPDSPSSLARREPSDTSRYDQQMDMPRPIRALYIGPTNPETEVIFSLGDINESVKVSALTQGYSVENSFDGSCASIPLKFVVENDSLYVSTRFWDLRNGNIVGEIIKNRWTLYLDDVRDWDDTQKDALKVWDKMKFPIFAVQLLATGVKGVTVRVSGYFLGPSSVLILSNRPSVRPDGRGADIVRMGSTICIPYSDKDWKDKTAMEMLRAASDL